MKNYSMIKRPGYKKYLIMLIIVALFFIFSNNLNLTFGEFVGGIPRVYDFISRMFPPDLTNLSLFLKAAWQTIEIAFVGTILGTIGGFILGFLGARNIVPNKIINYIVRGIMDTFRGLSEIIWALIFVAMVGLGPFPGILALSIHVSGALGRFFSETIENCRPHLIDVVRAAGGSKLQVISHAIIPEVKPLFMNYIFYYFEHSIRAATILGLVGAGGIGVQLVVRIKLFRYHEVLTILIIIVLMVFIFDKISAYVRKRNVDANL